MLNWSLNHRFVMLLIALSVSASAFFIFPRMGVELVPEDDQCEFSVSVNLPRGTTFAVTEAYTKDVEPMLRENAEMSTPCSPTSTTTAHSISSVSCRSSSATKCRNRTSFATSANLMRQKFPGLRTSVSGGTDISGASTAGGGGPGGGGPGRGPVDRGGGGNRLNLLVQGPEIDQIQEYVVQLVDKLKADPGHRRSRQHF